MKLARIYSITLTVVLTGYTIYFIWSKAQETPKTPQATPSAAYSQKDYEAMCKSCYAHSKFTEKYPVQAKKNCDCFIEGVMKKYTKQELAQLNKLSMKEIYKKDSALINTCAHLSGIDTLGFLPDSIKK